MERIAAVAWILWTLACTKGVPSPALQGITPDVVTSGETTTFSILGTNFFPAYRVRFDEGRIDPGEPFRVWLGDVELLDVKPSGANVLTAILNRTVLSGFYDLRVQTPGGDLLLRLSAVEVVLPPSVECDANAQCVTLCHSAALCVANRCVSGSADKDSDGDGLVDGQCTGGTDCDDENPACGVDCTDGDGDSVCADSDCDDSVGSGEGCSVGCIVAFRDDDGDTYGRAEDSRIVCTLPARYSDRSGDCVDANPSIHPGRIEGPAGSVVCMDGQDNDCDGATDAADSVCLGNVPPSARLSADPGVGEIGTVFAFDGSASSDLEDDITALDFAWDWDGDGIFDATGIRGMTTFGAEGLHTVTLRVMDTGGATDYAELRVVVASASNTIVVPDGGTLTEAIVWADGLSGRQAIWVRSGYIDTPESSIPGHFDAAGVDVIGYGARVDGDGIAGGECLRVDGSNNLYVGLEIHNCSAEGIRIAGTDNRVESARIWDVSVGAQIGGSGNILGPGTWIESANTGVMVEGPVTIMGTTIMDATTQGIRIRNQGGGSVVQTSIISDSAVGILLGAVTGVKLRHLVFYDNGTALQVPMTATAMDLQNSAFVQNMRGILGADNSFAVLDYNDYWLNSVFDCSACTAGSHSLREDPGFVDAPGGDFRLRPSSPLIDAGIDLGIDLNGTRAGSYEGSGPDMGAFEIR